MQRNFLPAIAIFFVILALGMSLIFWTGLPIVAKLALFAAGFGAGVSTGLWLGGRALPAR